MKLNEFEALQEAIRAALQPGETIVWQGMPQPRPASFGFMLILFIALAGLSSLIAFLFGDSLLLTIVAIASAFLYLSALGTFLHWLPALPIFYLITDRRALTVAAGHTPEIFEPSQMVFRERRRNADGSCDLYFFSEQAAARSGESHAAAGPSGFYFLRRASSAEKALLALMRRQRLPAKPAVILPGEYPSWLSREAVLAKLRFLLASS
jgi:hypothetical protein